MFAALAGRLSGLIFNKMYFYNGSNDLIVNSYTLHELSSGNQMVTSKIMK